MELQDKIKKLFDHYSELYSFEGEPSEYLINKENFVQAVNSFAEKEFIKQIKDTIRLDWLERNLNLSMLERSQLCYKTLREFADSYLKI